MPEQPTPRSTAEAEGLRVLAVDDEPPALSELTYLLERTDGIAEVTAAGSAAEALDALQSRDIDAVFLDIRMPGLDGLALARVLGRFAEPPPVVFVTAYEEHAVDAFDVAAVDYLLKPVRAARLAQAIERVQGRLAAAQEDSGSATTPAPEEKPADETIAVELGGVTRYVRRSEVVYAEAQRDYVRLSTRTGGHLVRLPLTSLEERWAPAGFLRVHRRFLVNSAYVEALRTHSGRVSVDLGSGQSVPVSRRFTAAVRQALVQRHRIDRDPPSPSDGPASPSDGPAPPPDGPSATPHGRPR